MRKIANFCLLAALVCFVAYFTNVALGAAKRDVFLGDISEMLLLLLSAALFVAGTLGREAIAKAKQDGAD